MFYPGPPGAAGGGAAGSQKNAGFVCFEVGKGHFLSKRWVVLGR